MEDSKSSLCLAQWVTKEPSFLHAKSEDSDRTELMHKLYQNDVLGATCTNLDHSEVKIVLYTNARHIAQPLGLHYNH